MERVNTGGTRDIIYNKDDLKRIRNEDTESTAEFKRALRAWRGGYRPPPESNPPSSSEQRTSEYTRKDNSIERYSPQYRHNDMTYSRNVTETYAAGYKHKDMTQPQDMPDSVVEHTSNAPKDISFYGVKARLLRIMAWARAILKWSGDR